MSPLSTPSPPHAFTALPKMLAVQPDSETRRTRDFLRDHNCPGHTFRPISFETLGRYRPGAMHFIREVAHDGFPGAEAGEHVAAVLPTSTANLQLCDTTSLQ
jgi:hypothetical protein